MNRSTTSSTMMRPMVAAQPAKLTWSIRLEREGDDAAPGRCDEQVAGGGGRRERRRAPADAHGRDPMAVAQAQLDQGAVAGEREDAVAGDDRNAAATAAPRDREAPAGDAQPVQGAAAGHDRQRGAERR